MAVLSFFIQSRAEHIVFIGNIYQILLLHMRAILTNVENFWCSSLLGFAVYSLITAVAVFIFRTVREIVHVCSLYINESGDLALTRSLKTTTAIRTSFQGLKYCAVIHNMCSDNLRLCSNKGLFVQWQKFQEYWEKKILPPQDFLQ